MKQNFILLLISMVLFVFVLVNEKFIKKDIYDNDIKNDNKEKFNFTNENNNCSLFVNTNRTQDIYLKLLTALKNLSNDNKIKLDSNCKEEIYIQGTSPNLLKREVNEITQKIINKLNNILKSNFRIIQLDTINVFEDKDENKNFIYNVFINDPNEELDIRLFIDVIKYVNKTPKKTNPITCAAVTTPGMTASGVENTFEIGYPQPEQLIPLPTEVITTSGGPDVLSAKGINIHTIPEIKSLYINTIKIYNTNAVINANNQCITQYGEPTCGNINGTSLSSSSFNQITSPFIEPAHIRNPWPIISSAQTDMKAWPYGKKSEYWNKKGVPISTTCNTQETGISSSTTEYPVEPSFWRSNYVLPKWSGPNNWLFSLTRGDVATEGADFTD